MRTFKRFVAICAVCTLITACAACSCRNCTPSKHSQIPSNVDSLSTNDNSEEPQIYTVIVVKPDNVTVSGNFTAEAGGDILFTATVDRSYALIATDAIQIGEPTLSNGLITYTYQVQAINRNLSVTLTATQIHLSGTFTATNNTVAIPANGSYTATLPNASVKYYALTWDCSSVTVQVDGKPLANDTQTAVKAGSSIVAYNLSGEELRCAFRLVAYVEEIGVMTVGRNEYTMNRQKYPLGIMPVHFQVTAGKTYTFRVTNGGVYRLNGEYPDGEEISSYHATSDGQVTFAICANITPQNNVAVTVTVEET